MTARRTAGKVGCGGPQWILFFPFRLLEPLMLQEGIGDHSHERVPVQALP
jgi:hypothetical protein